MNANHLAIEFSRLLRLYLTGEAMMLVIERNRNEPVSGICHSHDFVDANVVMLEAWVNLGGTEFNALEDTASALIWGKAWDIAQRTEFSGINAEHYRLAVAGEGPQAAQWKDKPHRLVYDLAREVERLQAKLTGDDIFDHCTAAIDERLGAQSEYFKQVRIAQAGKE